MAYDRSLLRLALGAILAIFAVPLAFIASFTERCASLVFGPLDHRLSLALDSIAAQAQAEADVSALKARFTAFFERSLGHDRFSGGQFMTARTFF